MGYGVMAYAVDIEQVRALCGSGDNQTRRAICGRFRADISRSNEWFDLSNDRGAPNIFTAIEHLVMGGEQPLDGYLYGYAFEYIVKFHGQMLDNNAFYPCPSSYLSDTVDPRLSATGAALSTTDLIFRGPPVAFPSPDDFPAIGYWTAAEVAAAVPHLQTPADDADADEHVVAVAGWAANAAARSRGIVGFYY